jgi:hypothetical protein
VRHIAVLILLPGILTSARADAETYRCKMDRQITVGEDGVFEDNREANKGREFYLAIDSKTQKGTYSACTQEAGCGTQGEISIVTRYESEGVRKGTKNLMIRLITGSPGQLGQLWSLELRGVSQVNRICRCTSRDCGVLAWPCSKRLRAIYLQIRVFRQA